MLYQPWPTKASSMSTSIEIHMYFKSAILFTALRTFYHALLVHFIATKRSHRRIKQCFDRTFPLLISWSSITSQIENRVNKVTFPNNMDLATTSSGYILLCLRERGVLLCMNTNHKVQLSTHARRRWRTSNTHELEGGRSQRSARRIDSFFLEVFPTRARMDYPSKPRPLLRRMRGFLVLRWFKIGPT